MSRIAKKSKTVTWTETREISIGHHNCIACGEETPTPKTDQLLAFAQSLPDNVYHEYMWPDRHIKSCHPPAWSWYKSQHHEGWLCFDCTQRVNFLISSTKK